MRFSNLATGYSILCASVLASLGIASCSSPGDTIDVGGGPDGSVGLAQHCAEKDDAYHAQCTATCTHWGAAGDSQAEEVAANPSCADASADTPTPRYDAAQNIDAAPQDDATSPLTDAAPGDAAPTTCTFSYSAWEGCQTNGTQTRIVEATSPAGCDGGTPVLTQSCVYNEGDALYAKYCVGCHGIDMKGKSVSAIENAIASVPPMAALKNLTSEQIAAISAAP